MAFDEGLAERVRLVLADAPDLYERLMFGGIAFMVGGHMACGVIGDELIARLGPVGGARALASAHVRPMDFTGRPMRGWLFIEPAGVETASGLRMWVGRALAHTDTKPEGTAGRARPPRRTTRPTAGARRTERD